MKINWKEYKNGPPVPADKIILDLLRKNSVLTPELIGMMLLNNVLDHFKVVQPSEEPPDDATLTYQIKSIGHFPCSSLLNREELEDETKIPHMVLEGVKKALETQIVPGTMRLVVRPVPEEPLSEQISFGGLIKLELSWISYTKKIVGDKPENNE